MKISVSDLNPVIKEYISAEVLPKATENPILQFILGFTSIKITDGTINNLIASYMPVLQAIGVVDKDEMIDVDDLHKTATKALQDYCHGSVEIMGYKADQDDLDALHTLMLHRAS